MGIALAASWFVVWGVYATYTWTAVPGGDTLQIVRFYVPAIGAISLLGAWLVARLPGRTWMAALASTAVVAAMFGLGIWSFNNMRESRLPNRVHQAYPPNAARQTRGHGDMDRPVLG